jgi:hypothetical protein
MQATPTPANEKLMVRYLLGELSEEQCIQIEDQAFQSEEYMQEILNVESDLIDDYVRGEIPAHKRSEFEKYFLASAERRRKVEFARALLTIENETTATVKVIPARPNPFVAFFRSLSPVGTVGFAVATLILITGAAWLLNDVIRLRSQLNQLQAERKTQQQERKELEQLLADERSRNEVLAAQLGQQKKEEVPLPQPKQEPPGRGSVLALTLLPGLSRGEGTVPQVRLKPDVRAVRLNVVIDPQDNYPKFGVEVRGPKGERVLSQTLRGGRKSVSLSLPAQGLGAGRYEVVLKGIKDGLSSDLGYYYFEVRR